MLPNRILGHCFFFFNFKTLNVSIHLVLSYIRMYIIIIIVFFSWKEVQFDSNLYFSIPKVYLWLLTIYILFAFVFLSTLNIIYFGLHFRCFHFYCSLSLMDLWMLSVINIRNISVVVTYFCLSFPSIIFIICILNLLLKKVMPEFMDTVFYLFWSFLSLC